MNAYHGYCYPDIYAVADAISAEPFSVGASSVYWFVPYTSSGNTVSLIMFKKSDSGAAASVGTFSRQMPICSEVGPLNPDGFMSGLTLSDSVELSWLVIGVWAVAFAFRAMRRPIR